MAELIQEYMARVHKLNAPTRLVQQVLADMTAARQEELLTHPGWEWYRRQIAEKADGAKRQLALLANEIVYSNDLGESLIEKKMRARGLQAEVHVYETVLALVQEAARKLTSLEEPA